MAETATMQRTKGPLVWLDMDQQALDDAYDQAVYAPNREQVHARRAANSAVARAVLGEPLRLQYGASGIEALDVYRCKRAERAGQRLYPRWRLAQRTLARVRLPGRAVRERRRAQRHRRFQQLSTTSAAT